MTTNQNTKTSKWEQMFDEKFMEYAKENDNTLLDPDTDGLDVKAFIQSLLSSERQRILERVEGMRKNERTIEYLGDGLERVSTDEKRFGYNAALDAVKSIIEEG